MFASSHPRLKSVNTQPGWTPPLLTVPLIEGRDPEQRSHGDLCTLQLKLVAFLGLPRVPVEGPQAPRLLEMSSPFCESSALCGRTSSGQGSLTKGNYCALHADMASARPDPAPWHSGYWELASYMKKQRLGQLRKLSGVTHCWDLNYRRLLSRALLQITSVT